jgi:hypothetical protein
VFHSIYSGVVVLGAGYDMSSMSPVPTKPGFLGQLSMVYIWDYMLSQQDLQILDDAVLTQPIWTTSMTNGLLKTWCDDYLLFSGVMNLRPNRICTKQTSVFPACAPPAIGQFKSFFEGKKTQAKNNYPILLISPTDCYYSMVANIKFCENQSAYCDLYVVIQYSLNYDLDVCVT